MTDAGLRPTAIIVMGVSGCGKSTIGRALADELGATFIDADDLHPEENRAKMAAGVPLTDADRAPWLRRVGAAIEAERGPVVVACSALRRPYRDLLRAQARRPIAFVHLSGSRELLAERLARRGGHFMPTALLDSQLATLEPLAADEHGVVIDIAPDPDEIVAEALRRIGSMPDA